MCKPLPSFFGVRKMPDEAQIKMQRRLVAVLEAAKTVSPKEEFNRLVADIVWRILEAI
jgi:hypothetical protein